MKRISSLIILLSLICSFALFGGCTRGKVQNENDPEKFRIVTSFYPVYVAVINLIDGADGVELINLAEPESGCMHDYKFSTDDINKMSGADLFIASGMGMEGFVGKTSFGIPRLEVLDCSEDIGHILEDKNEKENPHYWMNIENAIEQSDKIKRTLCRIDPKNAAVYEANAARYKEKLESLSEEVKSKVSELSVREIVSYHDSVEYFAEQFGITCKIISDEKDLSEALEESGIKSAEYVFVQKEVADDAFVRELTKALGCEVLVADVVASGEFGEEAKDSYINAIHHNVSLLEKVSG